MSGTRTDQQTPTLGTMLRGVTEDLSLLVREELALAKSELRVSAKTAATSSVLLVVAALLALLGLIFLLVTLAYVLVAVGLPVWAGFGIVTLVLLVLAGVLGGLGARRIRRVRAPERAMRQLQQTKGLLPGKEDAAPDGQQAAAPTPAVRP